MSQSIDNKSFAVSALNKLVLSCGSLRGKKLVLYTAAGIIEGFPVSECEENDSDLCITLSEFSSALTDEIKKQDSYYSNTDHIVLKDVHVKHSNNFESNLASAIVFTSDVIMATLSD